MSWLLDIENGTIWFQVEAETRGWLAIGFSSRKDDVTGSESLVGWANRDGSVSSIGMYNITKQDLLFKQPSTTAFKYWDEEVCQSREGRTIIKFKRAMKDGEFPLEMPIYKDNALFLLLAIGEEDKLSPYIEKSLLNVAINPSGNERPEGYTGRWIFHYIMVSIGILAFFVK